jgi:hypothetical protein
MDSNRQGSLGKARILLTLFFPLLKYSGKSYWKVR